MLPRRSTAARARHFSDKDGPGGGGGNGLGGGSEEITEQPEAKRMRRTAERLALDEQVGISSGGSSGLLSSRGMRLRRRQRTLDEQLQDVAMEQLSGSSSSSDIDDGDDVVMVDAVAGTGSRTADRSSLSSLDQNSDRDVPSSSTAASTFVSSSSSVPTLESSAPSSHIPKSIASGGEKLFLADCEHVGTAIRFARIRRKLLDPSRWLCCECGSTDQVWACLDCGRFHCGRNVEGHALDHFHETNHALVFDVNNDYVHCYQCDVWVANDNEAHEIAQVRDVVQKSRQAPPDDAYASDADFQYRESREERQAKFQKLDQLQTVLKRWQHLRLAKAFSRWREVVKERKASRASGSAGALTLTTSQASLLAQEPIRPHTATFNQMRMRRALAWKLVRQRQADSVFLPGQTGLRNIGNTCYMNSVLQALSYIPEMRDFFTNVLLPPPSEVAVPKAGALGRLASLQSDRASSSPTVTIGHNTFSRQATLECMRSIQERSLPRLEKVSVCMQLHALLRVVWSGRWSVVTPFNLHQALQKFVPKFRGYKQQDAQEFLTHLLDRVHTELTEEQKPASADMASNDDDRDTRSGPRTRGSVNEVIAQADFSNSIASIGKKSIVTDLFEAVLRSRVECLKCGDKSDTFDSTLDLKLQIPEKLVSVGPARRGRARGGDSDAPGIAHCTLEDCLREFTSVEVLGDKIRFCEKCKSNQDAEKGMRLKSAANVLCIVINRFYFTMTSRAKINTEVSFPLSGLDLAPYCAENIGGGPLLYDLMSVVVHHGSSVESGHYTAYCWNPETDTWYHYNDARVAAVSEAEVLAAQPYVMFYEKRDAGTPAPSQTRMLPPSLKGSLRDRGIGTPMFAPPRR